MSGGGSPLHRLSVGGAIGSRAAYGRARGVVHKPAASIDQEGDAWELLIRHAITDYCSVVTVGNAEMRSRAQPIGISVISLSAVETCTGLAGSGPTAPDWSAVQSGI